MASQQDTSIVDLNVGGVHYTTTMATLTRYSDSNLAQTMNKLAEKGWKYELGKDNKFAGTEIDVNSFQVFVESSNRIFIDRDGALFRFVLDFLRQGDKFNLPERFAENDRLSCEAEFYGLQDLVQVVRRQRSCFNDARSGEKGTKGANLPPVTIPSPTSSELGAGGGSPRLKGNEIVPGSPASFSSLMAASPGLVPPQVSPFGGTTQGQSESGTITVGYRGTFAFGRDGGMADVKFRKLHRILIAGRVQLCKEVFGDTLNESRDPDRGGQDRYTSRFFLKHVFLEQAFDMLYEAGFRMVGSCGSGTNSIGDSKPGMDSEESKWLHFNEFVFARS